MKVSILQENLAKGLSIVGKFVSSKAQLPILENILLVAETGSLKLSTTNLETGINLWLPAKIEKAGRITILAKIIVEFISSLPADKVFLELNQDKLEITCRNYKASFNGISASEFPAIPSLKNKKPTKKTEKFSLNTKTFINAINQMVFTAASDEARPILTGIKLEFLKNKLILSATDGYRLSSKEIELKTGIKPQTLIIPASALAELSRICSQEEKGEDKIILAKEENQIIFSYNQTEIITRLIEGEFPDFSKIIPQDNETKITVNKEELFKAIKTASILAKDSANIVKLKIKDSSLEIMADAPEVGQNIIKLEIKKQGKDGEIAFNYRFLQEYLNIIDEKEILLEINGSLKPGVFKFIKDSSFLHIIMPVRIQE